MKTNTLLLLLLTIAALPSAEAKLLCTDSGNVNGSFFLDITGFEKFKNHHELQEKRVLFFKPFRSFENPLIELSCGAANGFIDGPQGIYACRSGNPLDQADRPIPGVVQAVVFQSNGQLRMEVTGLRAHGDATVPCVERD